MNNSMIPLFVGAAITLLALIWLIANFNRFVRLRQHIRESWSGIDVELKRRYDFIPYLVETVKGYATHERSVLEEVVTLRNRSAASTGPAADQAVDESALALGIKRLFAVVENYPQLKSDANCRELKSELANTEDRLAAARRFLQWQCPRDEPNVRVVSDECARGNVWV